MTISNGLNRSFFQKKPFQLVNPSHDCSNFIHTSAILNSSNRPVVLDTETVNVVNETLGNTNVNVSQLELVRYRKDPFTYDDQDLKEIGLTSPIKVDFMVVR